MSEQPVTPTPEGTFNVDLRGVHYNFLKERVPAWFNQATAQRQQELAESEKQIARPDFWQNPEKSQKILANRKRLEEQVQANEGLARMLADLDAYFELAREGENVGAELRGINKNTNDSNIILFFRCTHESRVALMKGTHGWHKAYTFSVKIL